MKILDKIKTFLYGAEPEPGSPRCPNCQGTEWHIGPSGGLSTNIMCLSCEHWYNYHQGIIPMDDLHQVGVGRQRSPL